jgi:hypothetical protein
LSLGIVKTGFRQKKGSARVRRFDWLYGAQFGREFSLADTICTMVLNNPAQTIAIRFRVANAGFFDSLRGDKNFTAPFAAGARAG